MTPIDFTNAQNTIGRIICGYIKIITIKIHIKDKT